MSNQPGNITPGKRWLPHLHREHDLISYVCEYLDANYQPARVAGQDRTGRPFIAWLTAIGGLAIVLVDVESDGSLGSIRGGPGILNYPVTLLEQQ